MPHSGSTLSAKTIGCAGFATQSSVPGGLFGAPAEHHVRDRLDGVAGGRGNSSSVKGGIFGQENVTQQQQQQQMVKQSKTFDSSGITGGGGSHRGGGYGGGYHSATGANPWEGAAGGKSTNAGSLLTGHFRGGTIGGNAYVDATSGHAKQESSRSQSSGFSLDALEQAEQRDQVGLERVDQIESGVYEQIIAAAEVIALEQGFDEEQKHQLVETLLERHRQKMGYFQFSDNAESAGD